MGLALDVVTYLFSALALQRIHGREAPLQRARRGLRTEVAEGVAYVARDPFLRAYVRYGSVANLALTGYNTLVVVFLVRQLGLGSGVVGLLLSATGLGGVAGAFLAPRLSARLGSARALLLCKCGGAPFGLLVPLAGVVPLAVGVVSFLLGATLLIAGVVAGNVITAGFLPGYCRPELFARTVTSMQLLNYGSIPLGAVLAGLVTAGFALAGLALLRSPFGGRRDLPVRASLPVRPAQPGRAR